LLLFETVKGLEESFLAFVIEDFAHHDELACVVPFLISGKDVEGV